MADSATASKSILVRAVPTFTHGMQTARQFALWMVRRHPRWLVAFAMIAAGCGGLWLVDYFSLERTALRRLAEVRGWTAGPTGLEDALRGWQRNFVTRTLARIPSKKVVTGLVLEGKRPTDADLAMFVAAFPRIEQLDVSSTPITDDAMDDIAHLYNLDRLLARHTTISDNGAAMLSKMPQLQTVELDGTQITDAGLAELARLPKLSRLSVSHTRVTDAGLASLQATTLRSIDVSGTQVTQAGVAAFQAANPGCAVRW